MNEDNLISFKDRTTEEQREIAKQGGIASGKARREKKLFREEIEKQLGQSIADIVKAAIDKSKQGDIQASVFLRDTIGEKPTDKLDATIDQDIKINIDIEE